MIIYNMRNRGPYEYDKFTLNILQISNAICLSEMHELNENSKEQDSLLKLQEKVNETFYNLIGTEAEKGLTEKIYIKSYMDRGNKYVNQENVFSRI